MESTLPLHLRLSKYPHRISSPSMESSSNTAVDLYPKPTLLSRLPSISRQSVIDSNSSLMTLSCDPTWMKSKVRKESEIEPRTEETDSREEMGLETTVLGERMLEAEETTMMMRKKKPRTLMLNVAESTHPLSTGIKEQISSYPLPSLRLTNKFVDKSRTIPLISRMRSKAWRSQSPNLPFQRDSGRTSCLTDTSTSMTSLAISSPLSWRKPASISMATPPWNSDDRELSQRSIPMASGLTPSESTRKPSTSHSQVANLNYRCTGTTSTISSPLCNLSSITESSIMTEPSGSSLGHDEIYSLTRSRNLLTSKLLTSTAEASQSMSRLVSQANLPKTNVNTLPRSVAIGTSVPAMREPASSVTHAFSASPPNMLDPNVQIEITNHRNHPKPLSKFAEFSHARMVLEDDDGEDDEQGVGVDARGRFLPRFARGLGWRLGEKAHGSRTIAYTEVDDPLPRPPPCEYNTVAMETIQNNPDLFHVPQVISTERLEALLTRHPNRLFVKSVITGLREGFWPWALTNPDNAHYPETWDNSFAPPHTVDEQTFINTQRDTEHDKHRFSRSFGPDLLPGMYSTPVIAVPKPRSSDLRLVSNQSAGEFSQNSMVDPVAVKGPRMDTMKEFIPALLRYRRENPHQKLVMWKSDVSEAYRLLPMHPLWQIKQVVTSNLPTRDEVREGQRVDEIKRSVDWCATFGNRASPRLWFSVIGLVLWIAMYVKLIIDIFCYVDDVYGWEKEDNLMLYKPFNVHIPVKQAQLLYLWDFLGIPHKLKKLLNGPSLPIIGFDVDPNAMTITLPEESKQELVLSVREFISTPSRRRSLHEFQMLAGWINWSLNVFPLLRPGLCNVYEKMRGKAKPNALIYLNEAVKRDLNWFIQHVERSSGTYLFDGMDWNPSTECNMTIYCDACLTGMGYWIPELLLGFYSPIPLERSTHPIFFFEALAVLSALVWYGSSMRSDSSLSGRLRLVIFTDNTNTVDIFDSLSARPDYNFILQAAVDELILHDIDLRVIHIKGEDNLVADAISRGDFLKASQLAPGIFIKLFQPPREPLGAAPK
ncbi:hypothetical protein C8R42DRAFT_340177 [Lentinula raphanica]|nr:hypothetical protein C8R42DRAFT_340177 [Lentinula raphanica]